MKFRLRCRNHCSRCLSSAVFLYAHSTISKEKIEGVVITRPDPDNNKTTKIVLINLLCSRLHNTPKHEFWFCLQTRWNICPSLQCIRVLSLVRARFLSLACVTRTAAFLEQHSWGHRTIHLLHLQPIAEIKGIQQKVILLELFTW